MEKLADGIVRSDTYLKTLFENGDKPTEEDFADLIESKAHKKEVFLKKDEVTNEDIDKLLEDLMLASSENNTFVMVDTDKVKEPKQEVKKEMPTKKASIDDSMMKAIKKPNTNNTFKHPKDKGFNKFNGNNTFGKSNTKKIRARIKK